MSLIGLLEGRPTSRKRPPLRPPDPCSAGSTACSRPEPHAPGLLADPVHRQLGRRLRPTGACWALSRARRRRRRRAAARRRWAWGSPWPRRPPRVHLPPRPRSALGAPSRNGAPPGCRAKEWLRWPSMPRPCRWPACSVARRRERPRPPARRRHGGAGVATIACTAMIYASLKPVPRWHHRRTVARPTCCLGLATGCPPAQCAFLLRPRRRPPRALALLALLGGWSPRLLARRRPPRPDPDRRRRDRPRPLRRCAPARGATHRGQLPAARDGLPRRAPSCRQAARVLASAAFAVPIALILAVLPSGSWPCARPCDARRRKRALGTLIERWLFFAEAQHTVTLYYGAPPFRLRSERRWRGGIRGALAAAASPAQARKMMSVPIMNGPV